MTTVLDEVREKQLDHMRRRYAKTAGVAKEHGWTITHDLIEDDVDQVHILYVTVEREGEQIKIHWVGGKLTECPEYTFAGVDTKLRNHSAMLKQMAEQPDPRRTQKRAKSARRRGTDVDVFEIIKGLPWDPEEMSDQEILRECYGRTLVWKNSITEEMETDRVVLGKFGPHSGPNWNKVNYKIRRSSTGRRVLSFVGTCGYRAVGVDALLRVM